MTEHIRFTRLNHLDHAMVMLICIPAGLCAALAGAHPTGTDPVDAALVAVVAGAATWAAASAPWWTGALACGIGAAMALDPAVAALGALGFLGGLTVGALGRDLPIPQALVGAVAVNTLIRSELDGFFGLSAIIGIAVCTGLFALGLARHTSAVRRVGILAVVVVGALALAAAAGATYAAASSQAEIRSSARLARAGVESLNDGDYEEGSRLLEQAAAGFRRAGDQLGGVIALPGRAVPGVAQNVGAARDLSREAATSLAAAADALGSVDPSDLALVDGAIDLAAVAAAEAPLITVEQSLRDLRSVTEGVASPWLIGPLQDELDELTAELAGTEERLTNAIDAVRLAPRMLGADGERRYLILFTSPAEARGLGGLIGNYAEVVVVDGRFTLSAFDRRSELEDQVRAHGATCLACPDELIDRYGRYGFTTGPDGGFGGRGWSNLTMPAHFPHVAAAAADLYPQSGGRPVDGVIVMDPYVVAALMDYTGPIDVPELDVTVTPKDAATFILEDQYDWADDGNAQRIDALESLGQQVIVRLLTGSLPAPTELARQLSPLVAERRLLAWTDDPAEQELLGRANLSGAFPDLGADGGFSVSVTNATGNKIDVFLDRDVDVTVEETAHGDRRLVGEVTLTNRAPATGLPRYVIGNPLGLPSGSSRLIVTFYGPQGLVAATLDDEPIDLEPATEGGWWAYGHVLDLGPGERATYRIAFGLDSSDPGSSGDDASSRPIVFTQPLARR